IPAFESLAVKNRFVAGIVVGRRDGVGLSRYGRLGVAQNSHTKNQANGSRCRLASHYCTIVRTPQGRSPTLIFFRTVCADTSTIETSFEGPLAVNSSFSSGERAMPQGRGPTSKDDRIFSVAGSTTTTFLPRPVVT